MASKITISIPEDLKQKLEEKIKETDFKSIPDYILYILKQMVSKNNVEKNSKEKVAYSDEDEIALKKKLKEMGYL